MIVLVLLGFVMCASTVAWHDPYDNSNEFEDGMDRFWSNFDRQMNNLGKKIENAVKKAKIHRSSSRIDGDEFKITIYLTGFNKEDIVVEVRNGNLIIQAINNVPGGSVNSYSDVRTLPDFVDEHGNWSYNNNILTIVFPILPHGRNDSMETTLPYVNSASEGDLDNLYDNSISQTSSAPSSYDYEEENQPPDNDVDNFEDNI